MDEPLALIAVIIAGLSAIGSLASWSHRRDDRRAERLELQLAQLQREWDQSVGARLPERVGALEDGRLADSETIGAIVERLRTLRDQLHALSAEL
jgi:type II secretory pathway pseudopilin PulG